MDENQAQSEQQVFSQEFGREFPELIADGHRMNLGQKPRSELWLRSARIFREMAAADPRLNELRGGPDLENAIVIAARRAKLEILAVSENVGIQLDSRLGPGWRPYQEEMLKLLGRLRVGVDYAQDPDALVDLLELLHFGVRFSTFSKSTPKTVQ